jgi:hypothetical protein
MGLINKKQIKDFYLSGNQLVIETLNGTKFYLNTTTGGVAVGDMTKAIYDSNDDGKVALADLADSLTFDGNRLIKTVPVVGENLGATTMEDWIEQAYFGFIDATITLNSFIVQEVGVNYPIVVEGSIVLNDETVISAREVRRNPTGANTLVATAPGNTISEPDTTITIVKGTQTGYDYQLRMTTGTSGTILSSIKTITGRYPFLAGMSPTLGLTGTALYEEFKGTKFLEVQGDKNVILNGTDEYIYFAYDATFGDLVSIKDNSGFEVIGSFTQTTPTVASTATVTPGFTGITYKVYTSNKTTVNPSGSFEFKFSL